MKVLFIYRHPDMGFSIGKVFAPIEKEMRKYCEVDSLYMPAQGYGLRALWQNIRAVKNHLRTQKYDVIHITGVENYLLPFIKKHKTLVTVHDLGSFVNNYTGIRGFLKKKVFIDTIKFAYIVTFISEKSMTEAQNLITLDSCKLQVIHNPVDSNYRFKNKEINTITPVILHIGTKLNKNLSRSIEALKTISCHLRIVGSLSSAQKQELGGSGIDYSNVWNIDDQQMLAEYENCDIVNFPSTYEGFGMPIIEGQSIGRLVLTSNIEPMNTIGGDGVYLVDPYDVESIKEGYNTLLSNSLLRESLIVKGVKNAENFDVKSITKKYFELYKNLM